MRVSADELGSIWLFVRRRPVELAGCRPRYANAKTGQLLDMTSAWLSIVFNQVEYAGSIVSDEDCDCVVKGALALFAVDKMDDGKRLSKLVAGSAQAVAALTRLIRSHFGAPGWDFGL
ncbi:hypothetical protein ACVMAJ_000205 [Bradyrhizobium sp. USDA 4448]